MTAVMPSLDDQTIAGLEATDLAHLLHPQYYAPDHTHPVIYDHGEGGVPAGWVVMMKNAMSTLSSRFSASRMVADYTRQAYLPAESRGTQSRAAAASG